MNAARIAAMAAAAALALAGCDVPALQTTPPPPPPTAHVTKSSGVRYQDVESMRERIRAAITMDCGESLNDGKPHKPIEADGRRVAMCDVVPGSADHVFMSTYADAQQEGEREANYRTNPSDLLWEHFGDGWSVGTGSRPTLDRVVLALTGHTT